MDSYCGEEMHIERINNKLEDTGVSDYCKSKEFIVPTLASLAKQLIERRDIQCESSRGLLESLESKFPGFQTSALQKTINNTFQASPSQRTRIRCGISALAKQQIERRDIQCESSRGLLESLESKFPGFQTSALQKTINDSFQASPSQRTRIRCGISACLYWQNRKALQQTKETASVIRPSQSEQGMVGYVRSPLIDEIISKQQAKLREREIKEGANTRPLTEDTNNNGDIKYKGKRHFFSRIRFWKNNKLSPEEKGVTSTRFSTDDSCESNNEVKNRQERRNGSVLMRLLSVFCCHKKQQNQ